VCLCVDANESSLSSDVGADSAAQHECWTSASYDYKWDVVGSWSTQWLLWSRWFHSQVIWLVAHLAIAASTDLFIGLWLAASSSWSLTTYKAPLTGAQQRRAIRLENQVHSTDFCLVCAQMFGCCYIRTSVLVRTCILTMYRSRSSVRVMGSRWRSYKYN